jgi:hypothetical protein
MRVAFRLAEIMTMKIFSFSLRIVLLASGIASRQIR